MCIKNLRAIIFVNFVCVVYYPNIIYENKNIQKLKSGTTKLVGYFLLNQKALLYLKAFRSKGFLVLSSK